MTGEWEELVAAFAGETAFHGLPGVFSLRKLHRWKVTWLSLTLLAHLTFWFYCYDIVNVVFVVRPTVTAVSFNRNSEMRMPIVKLCDRNPDRSEEIRALKAVERSFNTSVWHEANWLFGMLTQAPEFVGLLGETVGDTSVRGKYPGLESEWELGGFNRQSIERSRFHYEIRGDKFEVERYNAGPKLLLMQRHELSEHLVFCSWKQDLNCLNESSWRERLGSQGMCFQFYAKDMVRVDSDAESLHLIINFNSSGASTSWGSGLFYDIYAMDSDERIANPLVSVGPGKSYSVGMSKHRRIDSTGTSGCRDEPSYSQLWCRGECRSRRRNETCGCVVLLEDFLPGAQYCDPLDIIWCNFSDPVARAACDEECPTECDVTWYEASVSFGSFPNSPAVTHLPWIGGMTQKEAQMNFAEVKIFMRSLMTTETSVFLKYSAEDLVMGIGGLLGLFLGASLFTLAEVVELLASMFYVIMRRCCTNNTVDAVFRVPPTQL